MDLHPIILRVTGRNKGLTQKTVSSFKELSKKLPSKKKCSSPAEPMLREK